MKLLIYVLLQFLMRIELTESINYYKHNPPKTLISIAIMNHLCQIKMRHEPRSLATSVKKKTVTLVGFFTNEISTKI